MHKCLLYTTCRERHRQAGRHQSGGAPAGYTEAPQPPPPLSAPPSPAQPKGWTAPALRRCRAAGSPWGCPLLPPSPQSHSSRQGRRRRRCRHAGLSNEAGGAGRVAGWQAVAARQCAERDVNWPGGSPLVPQKTACYPSKHAQPSLKLLWSCQRCSSAHLRSLPGSRRSAGSGRRGRRQLAAQTHPQTRQGRRRAAAAKGGVGCIAREVLEGHEQQVAAGCWSARRSGGRGPAGGASGGSAAAAAATMAAHTTQRSLLPPGAAAQR